MDYNLLEKIAILSVRRTLAKSTAASTLTTAVRVGINDVTGYQANAAEHALFAFRAIGAVTTQSAEHSPYVVQPIHELKALGVEVKTTISEWYVWYALSPRSLVASLAELYGVDHERTDT